MDVNFAISNVLIKIHISPKKILQLIHVPTIRRKDKTKLAVKIYYNLFAFKPVVRLLNKLLLFLI